MDLPSSDLCLKRPAKRKRKALHLGQGYLLIVSDGDQRAADPKMPRKTKIKLPLSPILGTHSSGVKAIATTMTSSLINEIKQILHKAPFLVLLATEFLSLYFCL